MHPNYNLAVSKSIEVLMEYDYGEIPIQLDIVLKALKRTIQIYPYSSLLNDEVTIEEIYAFFESELGACSYDHKTERYVIYYNDTKNNQGLSRFTIAHELGHIFLEHHKKIKTDILLREGISDKQYDVFEKEANCFARNFLSPYPLVFSVTDVSQKNNQKIYDIMDAFKISYQAAKTRIGSLKLDSYRITQEHIDYFRKYKISYGYYCTECLNAVITPGTFCTICGAEKSVFEKGVDRLTYDDGVQMNENMRVMECPRCENEEFSDDAEFCKICGLEVYNYCAGEKNYDDDGEFHAIIYHKNPSNARYCETCGAKTVFFEEGILQPWQEYQKEREMDSANDHSNDDDFPF